MPAAVLYGAEIPERKLFPATEFPAGKQKHIEAKKINFIFAEFGGGSDLGYFYMNKIPLRKQQLNSKIN